ncbi:hypothetical protein KXW23_000082 [Aspergillus fumigatus]|nr:hypothetical protein KXW23_000082 [Aspergillus fumigatus]
MSERGYDSDAQFISTPTHIADNVKAAASIGREGVLPAQPYPNEGNSFLAKDGKCPVYQHTEVSLSSPEHESWSPQAMHGFFKSHEPNVQSPKARGSPRPSASLNNRASSGENNANCGLVPAASASAASLNIFEGKDIITPTLQEQSGSPGRGSGTLLHTFNLVSPSTERYSELLITKRRQRHPTCEDQSIHLADLGISKMLASASTSPVILSPSQSSYEDPHSSTSGIGTTQYQGGGIGRPARILTPVWDGGVLKLGVQDARQASSCYSPRTSSASADVPANLEKREVSCSRTPFAALSSNSSSRSVSLLEKHVPSLDCGSLGKTDALKSRFTEQFDLNRSITSLGSVAMRSGVTSPRKVSIGWMSGGRRLGYGYTVVDGDTYETAEKDSGKASSTRWESPNKPPIAHIIDRLEFPAGLAQLLSSGLQMPATLRVATLSSILAPGAGSQFEERISPTLKCLITEEFHGVRSLQIARATVRVSVKHRGTMRKPSMRVSGIVRWNLRENYSHHTVYEWNSTIISTKDIGIH